MDTDPMARDTEIVVARRERLANWIDRKFRGSQEAFIADALGRGYKINQGELSALLRHKSFGEKKALKLEEQGAMPKGYLVHPLRPGAAATASRELAEMSIVVSALARALALSIPAAGIEFVDELERMKPPPDTFPANILEAVRSELPALRNRNRT
jgi:hypothetical protein